MYTTVCTKNTHNNKYYPGRASVGIQDVIGRIQLNRLREYLAREFKLVPLERLVAFLLQCIRRHDVIFLCSRPFFLFVKKLFLLFFLSPLRLSVFLEQQQDKQREKFCLFLPPPLSVFFGGFSFFFSFLKLFALVHFTLINIIFGSP